MNDAPSLSKIILGSLVLKPAFLEIAELSEADFSTDREKKVFKIIAEIWEDKRPDEIDCAILAERLGGDGAATFIGSLAEGIQRLSPEMFMGRVLELKKKIISRRLASRLQKELAIELKTGTLDLAGIRAGFDELDRLSQPEKVGFISLADVKAKEISWLWPGRIPKSMLTLCCGDPGVGKSFCSIGLASLLSLGLPLPDSQDLKQTCGTLFIVGEDPLSEAVRPRADANGADCAKIFVLQEPDFQLTDTAKIRWIVERNKDIRLIVIDPLTGFFPAKTKYFEDPSVRAALLPLAGFAEESGVAVLAIAHFRKQEAEAAIHRVAGSIGLAGIARSILAVTRDIDDPERRLLMSLKANYSRRPPGLAFRIFGEGMKAKIVFEDKPIETDAEDALFSNEQREVINEKKFKVRWLLDFLKDGPKTIKEIVDEAPFHRATLFRLADKLEQAGKIERVPGTEGRFKIWRLPE